MAARSETQALKDLCDVIAENSLRTMFAEFVDVLSRLHSGIDIEFTAAEVRATLNNRQICRIVPYRELLHVQTGGTPVWETRVRDEVEYWRAVDRVVDGFLQLASSADRPRT